MSHHPRSPHGSKQCSNSPTETDIPPFNPRMPKADPSKPSDNLSYSANLLHPVNKNYFTPWQFSNSFPTFTNGPLPTQTVYGEAGQVLARAVRQVSHNNESVQTDHPAMKDMSVQTDPLPCCGLDSSQPPFSVFPLRRDLNPLSLAGSCTNSLSSDPKGNQGDSSPDSGFTPASTGPTNRDPSRFLDDTPDVPDDPARMDRLCLMIQTLFLEGVLRESHHSRLPFFQKQLCYYLIKRKFVQKYMGSIESPDVTTSFPHLRQLTQIDVVRRPEECYKFVLTRVLKHLRKRLEAEDPSRNSEARLYELFFGPTSRDTDTPIAEYYYPLTNNAKGQLHFNSAYLTRIFQSDSFCAEVDRYAADQIYVDFRQELLSKVSALFKRWERCLSDNPALPEYSQQSILKYVIFSKHCKLPWTLADVTQAAEKIRAALRERRPEFRNIDLNHS